MNVLVTGATGFVGIHMLTYLQSLKNLNCYAVTRSSAENNHIKCDLSDIRQVREVLSQLKPELIFHFAGSFSNNFDTDFRNNVLSAKNLLDVVLEQSLSVRVVLMGSAAEYGVILPGDNPVKESHVLRPISVYGWSKAAQTQLASLYHSTYKLEVIVARTFNLSGSGISDKLFVGSVQKQIDAVLSGECNTITVGNLDAERDYIDISDACKCYLRIALHGAGGEVYNVGSGQPVSMRQLLINMLNQAGIDSSVIRENDATGKETSHASVGSIYADISKLGSLDETCA